MKKFYTIVLTVLILCSHQSSRSQSQSQCEGVKGPNLLAAKGTFSNPFVSVNTTATTCMSNGTNTFSPIGNVGNALQGCLNPGVISSCSNYTYTSISGGLEPEFTYSILKNIGDNSGGNCIKGDWVGKDHTGDGGYFMAVNGAPANTFSPIFYQIKTIPVCIGATYEFSAWVINLLPASSPYATPGTEPNISFKVNGNIIANSGAIAYNNSATWVKVTGAFVATTSVVDLEVVNATSIAIGNDLGLDDISINVCQSQVSVSGTSSNCTGNNVSVNFTVTDNTQSNTWYKWQKSTDGGFSLIDIGGPAQAVFSGNTYTLTNNLGLVSTAMNGTKYRLVVSTSQAGLLTPDCLLYNDYTLNVADCGPLPVKLTAFTGRYSLGKALLDWQTSQELNNDRFEIYRSNDGLNFVKVGSIKSAGNSNLVTNYNFQDNISGNSGNNVYYRLKQIDVDGKATFSAVVKLALGEKTSFDVFPNPFNNNFTVAFGVVKASTASLIIRNSAGNMVYSKTIYVSKGNNTVLINSLPTLGSGVYYLNIYNEELNFNGKLQKL